MSKHPKPSPEVLEYSQELAKLLGETEKVPTKQIQRTIQICGIEFARQIYDETAKIEDDGGLMLPDNSRRRTRGGVFFHLVRSHVTDSQRQEIFPGSKYTNLNRVPLGVPLLTWEPRIEIFHTLESERGEIKSMKVSLSGRPGNVEKRPEVIVTTMSYAPTLPNMPRGIPTPPMTPTVYTIYMAPKQWERVEASLADPADNLLIDGIGIFDPEVNGIAVIASSVRSELLEAKMREEQKASSLGKNTKPNPPKAANKLAESPAKNAAASRPQAKESGKKSRIADMQSDVELIQSMPLNPKLPPDVARKLNELNASASLFRQKVNNLLSKPPGQQFGLEMTQKLLKNVEDEIAALQKKYNG